MSVRDLERRILSLPARPVRLRKRKQKRRGKSRADDDDEEEEDKPAPKGEGEDDKKDEESEEGDDDKEETEDDQDDKEESANSPGTIEGYAAVFHSEQDPGTEYELWSDPTMRAVERVARGAFARACREGDDCRALYNHNSDAVLGRTSSGTCRIEEDEKGLKYSVDLPDTTVARDLASLVDRGDINGSSFGFVVEQESWRESEEEGGKRIACRTIESVRLLDVGPVTYPAYSSATAGTGGRSATGRMRALGSVEEARSSYQQWKKDQESAVPLAAKLAAIRARACSLEV
jgi:HK97 family phage prohead protease